eukprot:CFRG2427T1
MRLPDVVYGMLRYTPKTKSRLFLGFVRHRCTLSMPKRNPTLRSAVHVHVDYSHRRPLESRNVFSLSCPPRGLSTHASVSKTNVGVQDTLVEAYNVLKKSQTHLNGKRISARSNVDPLAVKAFIDSRAMDGDSLTASAKASKSLAMHLAKATSSQKKVAWRRCLDLLEKWRTKNSGLGLNVVNYTHAMKACAVAGRYKEAKEILETMRNEGHTPNQMTYNTLMSAYEKAGKGEEAIRLFNWMKTAGIPVSAVTYNTCISAAFGVQRVRLAETLLSQMWSLDGESPVLPNTITFNAVITGYGQVGDWQKALSTFKHMPKIKIPYNNTTYNNMLHVLANNGRLNEMENVYNSWISIGGAGAGPVIPLKFAHAAMPSQAGKTVKAEEPDTLPDVNEKTGRTTKKTIPAPRTDETVVLPTIQKMMKLGMKLFKSEHGHVADIKTYNIVMNGYANAGRVDVVMYIMDQLKSINSRQGMLYRPNEVTYNTCIKACGKKRDWRTAVLLLNEMRTHPSLSPTIHSYNSVLDVCVSCSVVHKVRATAAQLLTERLSPHIISSNITNVLWKFHTLRMWEASRSWFRHLHLSRPLPITGNQLVMGTNLQCRENFETHFYIVVHTMCRAAKHRQAVTLFDEIVRVHHEQAQLRKKESQKIIAAVPNPRSTSTCAEAVPPSTQYMNVQTLQDTSNVEPVVGFAECSSMQTNEHPMDHTQRPERPLPSDSTLSRKPVAGYGILDTTHWLITEQSLNAVAGAMALSGRAEDALDLFDNRRPKVCAPARPSLYTMNTIIQCLGEEGKWRRAEKVFQGLSDHGLVVDSRMYNTMMEVYACNGQVKRMTDLMRQIETLYMASGGNKDIQQRTTHINSHTRAHTSGTLNDEVNAGVLIAPNQDMFVTLFRGVGSSARTKKSIVKGLAVSNLNTEWRRMRRLGVSANESIYVALFDALASTASDLALLGNVITDMGGVLPKPTYINKSLDKITYSINNTKMHVDENQRVEQKHLQRIQEQHFQAVLTYPNIEEHGSMQIKDCKVRALS